MSHFPGYRFSAGDQPDPGWGQYISVLYPSPENLERIANMDLLEELVKKGDVLTLPRRVQHWMSFRSEQSRALFREAAAGVGYGIVKETQSDGEFAFGITVTRTQPIEQRLIDDTVIELVRLCRSFNGDYEGWETPVVTR